MSTKNKKKPSIPIIITCIIVVFVGVALFIFSGFKKTTDSANVTYRVIQETVKDVIEVSGTVEAAQSQNLQIAGTGTVIGVYASVGDTVKKGQVLVELDKTEQKYELAKLENTIAQTRLTGSPKDLEVLLLQQDSLEKKLQDREIIANFDGVLADFSVSVGDYLEAKDSVGTLVERSYLKAYVEVVETDAPKLSAGQKVYCSFPAYPQEILEGTVVAYPAVGTLTSRGASIVEVEIRIDNTPDVILPNYSFTGEIEISPTETVTLVSTAAVGRENNQMFVEKITGSSTEKIFITGEAYGSGYIKITEGNLQPGDVLKAQSTGKVSGTMPGDFRVNAGSSAGTGNSRSVPTGGAMMIPGPGAR